VQPGPPERLVGVDVADPGDQRLVQQSPLDLGAPGPEGGYEPGVGEVRVHRVAGDVRDLGGQLGAALGHREATERTLVDEAQLRVAVSEAEPDP
jgi:hypothetical protein